MPKQKPPPLRRRDLVPGGTPDAPGSGAPEAALRSQRTSSSGMERALPHTASSEETSGHDDRDEPGVPGYLGLEHPMPMRHPNEGVVEPDDLPFDEILSLCTLHLGEVRGVFSDWQPLARAGRLFEQPQDASDPGNSSTSA